jgi:hypothetical protein
MDDSLIKLFERSLSLGDTQREWWWCTDGALMEIGNILNSKDFLFIDNFLPYDDIIKLSSEVLQHINNFTCH